jgi:NADPH-dependent ferric siderophore reductase
MRDYTPRRFDNRACELDIEFALHGDGPAAAWAARALPGQTVGIGGPRGSFIVPKDFDWHLLIGDETALPAIARRLEELPAGRRALVVLAIDAADCRPLDSAAAVQLQRVAPNADALVAAVADLRLPEGEGYAWAAGEAHAMARVREVLVGALGIHPKRCRCAAYWKTGATAHHENLEA